MEALAYNPMPDTFETVTRKFAFGGFGCYATAGANEDRSSGYLRIDGIELPANLGGLMKTWADTFTAGWQNGTPLRVLIDAAARGHWGPCGFTGDPDLGYASSPTDPVVRWLGQRFLGDARPSLAPPEETAEVTP